MAKLTREQKIDIYNKRKNGETLTNLSLIYGVNISNIKYLYKLISLHGLDVLRDNKNKYCSPEFKIGAINRVLINYESRTAVALDLGLSGTGMLTNWIRKYENNGYNIIEKKRGRLPMSKNLNKNRNNSVEDLNHDDSIKELKRRLEYVEAENEYLKKLKVIVDERVEREKKKKQK